MKTPDPTLARLETAARNAPADGYLGINDLNAALENPAFDWGPDPAIRQSAQLVVAASDAGDTEALSSLGFFTSSDGQLLYDLGQKDFSKTLAHARSFGLPTGRLDGIRGDGQTDQYVGLGDIEAALKDQRFDWGTPQARAYAEYLVQTGKAGNDLSAAGFFKNSENDWISRNASLSWFQNTDYIGTSLTTDLLDHVWQQGYGPFQNPQTDAAHLQALTAFFIHLKNDFNMDVARLGASWIALEPQRGVSDAEAENRLITTLQAASDARLKILLGVGAKSASDAGQFREVPAWANNGVPIDAEGSLFKAGQVLGQVTATTPAATDSFSRDLLGFTEHVMSLVTRRLDVKAQDNIVGLQLENEPFNDMGNGSFDPELLRGEAAILRRYLPGAPIIINHWSNPERNARVDAVQQAAEIADFIGFDVYVGGASNGVPWQQTHEAAWHYPAQYHDGIPRTDGSKADIFIAELQASTWANDSGQGFVANGASVAPLIQQAQELGLNILFWRQSDLEGISPVSGQFEGATSAEALSLAQVEAQTGQDYGQAHTP